MKNTIYIILLLVITFTAFAPSLKNGFVNMDDNYMLTENTTVKTLDLQNVKKYFTTNCLSHYIPAALLSYAVEYRLFGLNPVVYHADNLILHLLNTLLVFWCLFLLCGNSTVSFLTALFFGIHPMHVESVAWVTERKDVLYAFFFLSSMAAYLYFLKRKNIYFYVVSLCLFILSLLSKSMAVTLPVVLLMLDYHKKGKITWKDAGNKILFCLPAIVFGLGVAAAHGGREHLGHRMSPEFLNGAINASNGVLFYLAKLAFPAKLSCLYPYSGKMWSLYNPLYLYSPFVAAALAAGVFYLRRFSKELLYGGVFFLVVISPVLQFRPFGLELPSDRFVYVASIGLFYAMATLFTRGIERLPAFIRLCDIIALAVLIAVTAQVTWNRCEVWKDSITLWSDVINKYPDIPRAYYNRALEYESREQYDLALQDYSTEITLKNDDSQAYLARGILYGRKGEFDMSIADFNEVLKMDPAYSKALMNRAISYYNKKDYIKAESDIQSLLEAGYPIDDKFIIAVRRKMSGEKQ